MITKIYTKAFPSPLTMKAKNRIEIFNSVRDLPFRITGKNPMYCSKKCNLLKKKLANIGMESKIMVGSFKWTDLALPKDILRFINKDPEGHAFLRVYIPETKKWVDVDPTWDNLLSDVFQISEWDGKSDTILMTKLNKIREHKKAKFLRRLYIKIKRKFIKENNHNFYVQLDTWLDSVRKSKI
jgi:hypothetical protein